MYVLAQADLTVRRRSSPTAAAAAAAPCHITATAHPFASRRCGRPSHLPLTQPDDPAAGLFMVDHAWSFATLADAERSLREVRKHLLAWLSRLVLLQALTLRPLEIFFFFLLLLSCLSCCRPFLADSRAAARSDLAARS